MLLRVFLCLALLSAIAAAASPGFLLGTDYSELASFLGPIAIDASGALYGFSYCQVNTPPAYPSSPPCMTKLSADGQTILWQNTPGRRSIQLEHEHRRRSKWRRLFRAFQSDRSQRVHLCGEVDWRDGRGVDHAHHCSRNPAGLRVDCGGRARPRLRGWPDRPALH